MEEIQVGTYVRFYDGNIDKIISITDTMTENKLIGFKKKNTLISNVGFKHRIKKYSKDITDLIEKDDYVNGCRVYEVEEKGITVYQKVEDSTTDFNWIAKNEVERIWTKEQLKYIEYNIN